MARIRTVKPDIWSDGKFVALTLAARLLFIGALNFADDEGRFEDSPLQLKIKVFPGDVVDCADLITEICATGMWERYEVGGRKYIQIIGFTKHQKINRPQASTIPPPFSERSVNAHGTLTEHSLGKVRKDSKEGNGRDESFDYEKAVDEIIGAHSKPDYSPLTKTYVLEAIKDEEQRQHLEPRDAAIYILRHTRRVAKSIDNPKFAKNAQESFLGRQYRPSETEQPASRKTAYDVMAEELGVTPEELKKRYGANA